MPPLEAFWAWFEKHQAEYLKFDPSDVAVTERLFSAFQVQLGRIDENLAFEFGPKNDGKRELVISADGIKASFPAVTALVAAAPTLERWNFIAFRPRRIPVNTIKIGGLKLNPEQIFVQLAEDEDRIALRLFIPGFSEGDRRKYAQGIYLLLDEALGEYDVETKVGGIDLQPLTAGQPPSSVKLSELGPAFDSQFPQNTTH